jgi:Xaa-Pro aminopeptidase
VTLDLARMRRERHRKLVDLIDAQGLTGLVLLGQNNVAYATGATVPAADPARASALRSVAILTPGDDAPHVFTAFADGAPPELPDDHLHEQLPVEWATGAHALAARLPDGKVAIDDYTMALWAALAGRDMADASAVLAPAKVVKTADELECIRRAQSINEAAMLDVEAMVEPGVRCTDLSGRFLRRVQELGASSNTVDPIFQVMPARVGDGPWSATGDVVFPTVTTDRELRAGDVVWVDTGIAYHGYASDFGRTWIVGREPTAEQHEQFRVWRDVVDRVLEVVRPGATGADLTRAACAASELTGRRPWLPHLYLAHGVGTDSAEMPLIGTDLGADFDASIVLAPGMVLVLEPVAWTDGHAGYRAEEIVAVTESGWTMLSDHHYRPYE